MLVGQELSEPKTPVEPAASVSGDMSPGISCSEEAGIPRFYKRRECSIPDSPRSPGPDCWKTAPVRAFHYNCSNFQSPGQDWVKHIVTYYSYTGCSYRFPGPMLHPHRQSTHQVFWYLQAFSHPRQDNTFRRPSSHASYNPGNQNSTRLQW